MHLGLEDGDPICPEALYLTEESKEKVREGVVTVDVTVETWPILKLSQNY